jgi:hypothetical protein
MNKSVYWIVLYFLAMFAFAALGIHDIASGDETHAIAWLMLDLEMLGLQAVLVVLASTAHPTPGDLVGGSCFIFGVLLTLFAALSWMSDAQINVAVFVGAAMIMLCIKAAQAADAIWPSRPSIE